MDTYIGPSDEGEWVWSYGSDHAHRSETSNKTQDLRLQGHTTCLYTKHILHAHTILNTTWYRTSAWKVKGHACNKVQR